MQSTQTPDNKLLLQLTSGHMMLLEVESMRSRLTSAEEVVYTSTTKLWQSPLLRLPNREVVFLLA